LEQEAAEYFAGEVELIEDTKTKSLMLIIKEKIGLERLV